VKVSPSLTGLTKLYCISRQQNNRTWWDGQKKITRKGGLVADYSLMFLDFLEHPFFAAAMSLFVQFHEPLAVDDFVFLLIQPNPKLLGI
jgi:hypothetical protein